MALNFSTSVFNVLVSLKESSGRFVRFSPFNDKAILSAFLKSIWSKSAI